MILFEFSVFPAPLSPLITKKEYNK
jgi:hypothetical protein